MKGPAQARPPKIDLAEAKSPRGAAPAGFTTHLRPEADLRRGLHFASNLRRLQQTVEV